MLKVELKERVYGTLVCDADHRCIRITTRYELMDAKGGRAPFSVELREDHVSILTVNGHLVRQVWTGYVRSLCLLDLVAAIPAAAALVDELRVDAARDEFVRTVITEASDRFAQEVEVASVMGLLMAAARIGFDAPVEGRPFWEWARMFPECLPFTDLDRFRIDTGGQEFIDYPHQKPAPSPTLVPKAMLRPTHPFRAMIIAYFPTHDWVRARNGSRPIPEVRFSHEDLDSLIYQAGRISFASGRAAAIARTGALRAIVPALNDEPTFEGHALMHRVERGVPYLWMGSIEDALGFWIPIGLVQPDVYPAHGTLDGDLAYYEVDPYVPAMLPRNHDGRRGRSARTTAWIHLDGVADMLARVRADLLANDSDPYAKVARLDGFVATFLDDLDVYLREQVAGVSLACPTVSGRQVFVDLVIDGETHSILFDPWCREPWLTYEQAARVLKISLEAFRQLVDRLRRNDIISDNALRKRIGTGRNGRRTTITYVPWVAIMLMSGPISVSRHHAVSKWMCMIAMALAEGTKLLGTYRLDDFMEVK